LITFERRLIGTLARLALFGAFSRSSHGHPSNRTENAYARYFFHGELPVGKVGIRKGVVDGGSLEKGGRKTNPRHAGGSSGTQAKSENI